MAVDQFLRTHGHLGDCYDNLTYTEALEERKQLFKLISSLGLSVDDYDIRIERDLLNHCCYLRNVIWDE